MKALESLLGEVVSHEAADALEARHRDSMIALLRSSGAPLARSSFFPGHITASLYIVDPATRSVLLHHHRRLDRWLQMGGHLEEGESPAVAALREGREESGLTDLELVSDRIADLDVHAIPAGKGEPDHYHFDVRYIARTASPAAVRMDEAESKELAWIGLDRAIPLMNEEASTRVVKKIEALFREGSLT